MSDPPSNNNTITYVLGSVLTVSCVVTPAPPPNSEFSWNCSTECLNSNVTIQQTINISELRILKSTVLNCSVVINDIQYYSELVELNVTGKHKHLSLIYV